MQRALLSMPKRNFAAINTAQFYICVQRTSNLPGGHFRCYSNTKQAAVRPDMIGSALYSFVRMQVPL